MTQEIEIKEPPASVTRTNRVQLDWADIMLRLSETAPGKWALVARDVSSSTANYLAKTYGVETRGVGHSDGRVSELYVRWVPGQSFLTPKAEKYRERRDRAAALRAKLAERQAAKQKGKTND